MIHAFKKTLKTALLALALLVLFWHALVIVLLLVWKVVPVTNSMFMLAHRLSEPTDVLHSWAPSDQIDDSLKRAAIASEDSLFFQHNGFDIKALKKAYQDNESGKSVRGGSTITQQLAKNLFLTSHRSYIRKAEEALITSLIELLWSKERILTVYLNVAEFGDGIYGAEAAAQHYYGKSAENLSSDQAAFLASILPNPKYYQDNQNARRLKNKIRTIKKRMNQIALSSN